MKFKAFMIDQNQRKIAAKMTSKTMLKDLGKIISDSFFQANLDQRKSLVFGTTQQDFKNLKEIRESNLNRGSALDQLPQITDRSAFS